MPVSTAGESPAPSTLNLQGNGEKPSKSTRALQREAAEWARANDLPISNAGIRVTVAAYQSSGDRDSYRLTEWLEKYHGFNPTMQTALARVGGVR